MRNLLAFVAILSLAAAVSAQPIPAPSPAPSPPAPPPKMIKKKVCERVDNEETTGSRLGSAPKICKIITMPAPATSPERG